MGDAKGAAMDNKTGQRLTRFSKSHPVLNELLGNWMARVGIAILVLLVVAALFDKHIAPYHPFTQDYSMLRQPPSSQHLMGTDQFGRDVFSRVVHGTRYVLLLGLSVVAIQCAIGVALGLTAGYFGGIADAIIMRLTDVMLSLPTMVLALAIAGVLGGGLWNVVIALGVLGWRNFARVIRGQVLVARDLPYVEAARASGATHLRILVHHILPSTANPLIILITVRIPQAIIWAAAMSYLGLGVQPPTPEWGSMLSDARAFLRTAWWMGIFPGIAIMLTVMAFNFLGDALNDALNPKTRKAYRR